MRVRLHPPTEGLGTFRIQAATAGRSRWRQKPLGSRSVSNYILSKYFPKSHFRGEESEESNLDFRVFCFWKYSGYPFLNLLINNRHLVYQKLLLHAHFVQVVARCWGYNCQSRSRPPTLRSCAAESRWWPWEENSITATRKNNYPTSARPPTPRNSGNNSCCRTNGGSSGLKNRSLRGASRHADVRFRFPGRSH